MTILLKFDIKSQNLILAMGTTASICNATNIILNIALSQVGPLHYQNRVMPGECWKQPVGKVWFTIDATLYTGKENIYTDWSVAKPIVSWSLIGVGVATGKKVIFYLLN